MKIEIKELNAVRLTKLFIAASRWLSRYADVLNDLNVYPVPDGDTGTNMSMTLQAVENELVKLDHEPDMNELVDIISEAVLLGARGNSGTILSQIIQGFLMGVKDKEAITVEDAAYAFTLAKERAYEAVANPVEGTMLTVIRRVAEEAMAYKGDKNDFITFLVFLKTVANKAVQETPNLLPKLKEAGVVDAGGKGIFYVLEGFEKSVSDPDMLQDLQRIVESQNTRKERMDYVKTEKADIKYKYCTEYIIEAGDFDLEDYKKQVIQHGDSMVCAQTKRKTKTHIHTNNPGLVLEIAVKYGQLNNIKIDNMAYQHKNLLVKDEEYKTNENYIIENKNTLDRAYFAIVDNKELGNYFIKAGATGVLLGGQTQNPSVADIEEGLKKIMADRVILLPNNKNIIATAKLAAQRVNKEVLVLETKSMLSGYYIVKNRKERLDQTLKNQKFNTGIEITKAVRDTKVDDLVIKNGEYIALVNGNIKAKDTKLCELMKSLLKEYITPKTLNVTVAVGKDADDKITSLIREVKDVHMEELIVGQENYPYYIYIENRDPSLPEIAIVTDSTSDLSEELTGNLNISVIPLKIKLGDEYYREGIDVSKKEFWKRIVTDKIIPKTSQPSPAEFKAMYERLLKQGYKKIISIHISSKLSGTQQAARVGKSMVNGGENVTIFDSKQVSFAIGYQAMEAARMAQENKSLEEIIARITQIRDKIRLYFVVNELNYLEKGGRIGKASSIIGGFLKVKPIIKMDNGELGVQGKAIGENGAISYLERLIKTSSRKNSILLYTGWGGTPKELRTADELRNDNAGNSRVDYKGRFEIGSTIGSHSGPVYGIAILPKII